MCQKDTLSEGVMLPRQETVNKLLNAPPPKTLKQLRAFLELASFYNKYVPNFAVIAAPLTDATKKGNPKEICWNENRERAFQRCITVQNFVKIGQMVAEISQFFYFSR